MASIFKRKGKGPYIISYRDHTGRRREKSSGTTDKRTAERIAKKLEADVALRRNGVIDPRDDLLAKANDRPLSNHIEDYLQHCRHVGLAAKHIAEKKRHFNRLLAETDAVRLIHLSPELVERNLQAMRDDDLSARTVNFRRQIVVTFVNWCIKQGRLRDNPLKSLPRLDEDRDRRRVRRPLNPDELKKLLDAAGDRGRKAWYMAAAYAGLRRSEIKRFAWRDIDYENQCIVVRQGKSKREDYLPLHPDLAAELLAMRPDGWKPTQSVFLTAVTDRTRIKDFLRAGIAREEQVLDAEGNPVMVGKRSPKPKTRIVTEDDEGCVIDLHALRTTLGTVLARSGVVPQVAQRS